MTAPAAAPVIGIVGPTATGKSDLAVELALRLSGEVVSADASQLYRGMDIGTAKLGVDQRRGIPHHQLDVLDVTDETSVAAYQQHARADLEAIASAGHQRIVVGGTGLYVRAALDVLEIPPTDPAVRARIESEVNRRGPQWAYDELARLDPGAAAHIQPTNTRRVVRALEVIELTGAFSSRMPTRQFLVPSILLGLRRERDNLDASINERVRQMWHAGLLGEVEHLVSCGLQEASTAGRAIGYAQALGQLQGRLNEQDAIDETQRLTRRLARRQLSWFRADPRIHWLDSDAPNLLDSALAVIRNAVVPDPSATMTP